MRSLASTTSYLELLRLALPEAVVVITALAVLTIGLMSREATVVTGVSPAKPPAAAPGISLRRTATGWCSLVAVLGVVIAIAAVLMLPRNANLFGGMLVITPLTSLFKIICLVLAFFTMCLVRSEKSLRHPGEYLTLILLATVGLMLLVGCEELLMIFIGLELLGLSLYVMAAFDKTDVRSAEAGLKYFLFGSTSSAFTLFGISLIYGMSGSTGLAAISDKLAVAPVQPLLATGIIMTLIGFAFKIAAAPFHLWARLLAYSAVAHAGYTLLGLVAGSRDGFSATLFYAAVYAITLVGAFGVVAVVRGETGGDDLKNFSGLAGREPLLAGCMAIFMLSLAGIPPLAGFFGKFYLFSAALRAGGNYGLLWLVALALLGSFVSLYYYLIVLKAIFVDEPSLTPSSSTDRLSSDLLQRITVAVLAAAILLLGLMPDTLAARILAAVS